jgi:hypothetical protein
MRENETKIKVQKRRFYDDDTLEKMKKYYGINDHNNLIKYIRLNGLEHHDHYDKNDNVTKSRQSS